MRYKLGVEEIGENLWIAWVFDLPGCFSNGKTRTEAISKAGGAITAYYIWQGRNDPALVFEDPYIDIHVAEAYHVQKGEGGYEINACFEDDRRSLTAEEVNKALMLLQWTRGDLMAVIGRIPESKRAEEIKGEDRKNINGVLSHLGGSEWWYLDRMGLAFPKADLPQEPVERLHKVREATRSALAGLAGDSKVSTAEGEDWTARKLVRRTLWHERDHTGHIAKLVGIYRGTGLLNI